MKFDKWTVIIFFSLIIVGMVVGWFIKPAHRPQLSVKETIVHDTIRVPKEIHITKTNIVYIDTTKPLQAFADSIAGNQDEVDYKIKHSIHFNKEAVSSWEVELKPLIKTITQYVTKDSVQTIVNTEYIAKPFFMDNWFYTSLLFLATTIIAIIF